MIPRAHWAGAALMALRGLHLRILSPEQRTLWNLYPVNQVFSTFYPFPGRFGWISKAGKTWEFSKWRVLYGFFKRFGDLEVIKRMGVGEKNEGLCSSCHCDPGCCRELDTANRNLLRGSLFDNRFAQPQTNKQTNKLISLSIVSYVLVTACN